MTSKHAIEILERAAAELPEPLPDVVEQVIERYGADHRLTRQVIAEYQTFSPSHTSLRQTFLAEVAWTWLRPTPATESTDFQIPSHFYDP
jgi:indole-3-glycerol phosphate synthase